MVAEIFRHIKIFWLLVKVNYLRAMEYRIDFITGILPTGMYTVAYIVFIATILNHFPSIAGWSFNQMLVLFSTEQLLYYSGWIFYRRSINVFPDLIRDGTLDIVLKTPVNSRFLISVRDQSPNIVLPFFGAFSILIYAISRVAINPAGLLFFITFLLMGMFLLYNLFFIYATVSFWTTEADEYVQLLDDTLSFGRYPLQIFPGFIGILLMTVIPAVLMIYTPATALMGFLDFKIGILFIVVTVITYFVSEKFWRLGLRHYSSASS